MIENKARDDTLAVRKYAWDRIGDHEGAQLRGAIQIFEAARLFNFTYVKLHLLDISDIEILEDVFPFVNTDVVNNPELSNRKKRLQHRGVEVCVCVCVCVCVFIKLHITAQSGPVILVILCHSQCVCVCVFIKLHITAQSGLVILVILCHSR